MVQASRSDIVSTSHSDDMPSLWASRRRLRAPRCYRTAQNSSRYWYRGTKAKSPPEKQKVVKLVYSCTVHVQLDREPTAGPLTPLRRIQFVGYSSYCRNGCGVAQPRGDRGVQLQGTAVINIIMMILINIILIFITLYVRTCHTVRSCGVCTRLQRLNHRAINRRINQATSDDMSDDRAYVVRSILLRIRWRHVLAATSDASR